MQLLITVGLSTQNPHATTPISRHSDKSVPNDKQVVGSDEGIELGSCDGSEVGDSVDGDDDGTSDGDPEGE